MGRMIRSWNEVERERSKNKEGKRSMDSFTLID